MSWNLELPTGARREWPAVIALCVYFVGYTWLYLIEGESWQPVGAPLLAAIAVFLVAELFRNYASD